MNRPGVRQHRPVSTAKWRAAVPVGPARASKKSSGVSLRATARRCCRLGEGRYGRRRVVAARPGRGPCRGFVRLGARRCLTRRRSLRGLLRRSLKRKNARLPREGRLGRLRHAELLLFCGALRIRTSQRRSAIPSDGARAMLYCANRSARPVCTNAAQEQRGIPPAIEQLPRRGPTAMVLARARRDCR